MPPRARLKNVNWGVRLKNVDMKIVLPSMRKAAATIGSTHYTYQETMEVLAMVGEELESFRKEIQKNQSVEDEKRDVPRLIAHCLGNIHKEMKRNEKLFLKLSTNKRDGIKNHMSAIKIYKILEHKG